MRQNFNTLLQTINQYKLFSSESKVLVAVSGGADSLALLHWLVHHQQQLRISLHVATLDHGLRSESQADVNFVKQMATQWDVPCTSAKIDTYQIANQHKISIETAARQGRYQFLAETANKLGTRTIVTAHHADDQSETILMHLLRGSGVQGLIGMQVQSPLPYAPHLNLVRPLLSIRRSVIEAYCQDYNLQARTDVTNLNTTYHRNEIRHEILPRLRQVNPQLDDALARLSDIVHAEDEYLTETYQNYFKVKATFSERVSVSLSVFQTWHLAIQRRFLVDALSHLAIEPIYEHIQHALDLIKKGQVGAIAEFKGDCRLRIGYDQIFIEPVSLPRPTDDYLQLTKPTLLNIPSETRIGQYKLIASYEKMPDPTAYIAVPNHATISLRTRQAGDRFKPQGLNGHSQKLKKWFINNKIPMFVRNRLPLVIVGNIIAAIILPKKWCIAEQFVKNKTPQSIVYFKIVKIQ